MDSLKEAQSGPQLPKNNNGLENIKPVPAPDKKLTDVFSLTTSLTDCQGLRVRNLSQHETARVLAGCPAGVGAVSFLGIISLHLGRRFGGTGRFDGHFPL